MLFKLKTGMGKHYIRRKGQMVMLKPGDGIDCEKYELGGAIFKFKQLEPDPPPPEPKLGLKAVHRGAGKWDVVNEATGVKINDNLLTKEEAQGMVSSLPEPEPPSAQEGFLGKPPAISKFYLSSCGFGSYNVIDEVGKQINDKPLNKGEAVDLAAKMTNEAVNLNCDSRSKGKGEESKEK